MPSALIDPHDGVLFDLDGVLYAGAGAVPGAVEAVTKLKDRGVRCCFVTNNASRSAEQVAAHLSELGIPAQPQEVYGSAPAGVRLMTERLPGGSTVLVTGSSYLRGLVQEAGFTVVERASDRPNAVIQGFDPTLGWEDLAEAAYAINAGATWFATNLDLSIPRAEGIAPGNGALAAAITHATGQHPQAAGKPEPVLFEQAAAGLELSAPLVVGDRLDTDILGGNRAEFTTALVLTGIDSAESAAGAAADHRPRWILRTLDDLFSGEHRSL
ncbi:HAD-IIA family hydrolase [Nesterenkonia cremea]|uniref:Sugar-phosphatase n=1 Tax=Nesterenkonia cremea TaxID=1882340 RepID=A0A917AQH5_9MICC|nr:HAD-IIA family hydrolase [Nesterenkonia cremea]GGE67273.1 sugar-phosphatase [Nesterenkonia cremea]